MSLGDKPALIELEKVKFGQIGAGNRKRGVTGVVKGLIPKDCVCMNCLAGM